jgi:hypothetical protein
MQLVFVVDSKYFFQPDKPKAYNMCFQTPCHKMTSQPQFGHPAGFKTKGCTEHKNAQGFLFCTGNINGDL